MGYSNKLEMHNEGWTVNKHDLVLSNFVLDKKLNMEQPESLENSKGK